MSDQATQFDIDEAAHTMRVRRSFAAGRQQVWNAWTSAELLDQWWAPQPYVAKTKSMDFREGGTWLYSMTGPKGDEHWSLANYEKVQAPESFAATDGFCDADGKLNPDMPQSHWLVKFSGEGDTTDVDILIRHDSKESLEQIVKMGFKEGFSAGLSNLDELLAKKA